MRCDQLKRTNEYINKKTKTVGDLIRQCGVVANRGEEERRAQAHSPRRARARGLTNDDLVAILGERAAAKAKPKAAPKPKANPKAKANGESSEWLM